MCFLCEKLKEYQLFLFAIILGIAIVAAAIITTGNIRQEGIFMTGSAEEIVKSDSATWTIALSTERPTRQEGYQAIQSQVPKVIEYLKNNGIDENKIDVEPLSFWTKNKTLPNGNYTNEIGAYIYDQDIKVSSDDVEKIKFLSTDIQKLIEQGVDLTSRKPEYQYSKLADLKVSLMEKAANDAKARANSALKVNGNKTGKILNVKTGVFQITAPDSTMVSDGGMNDTETIDKKVSAVVKVTFEIK